MNEVKGGMKWYHKFTVEKEKTSWIGMDEITLWDIVVYVRNRFTKKVINKAGMNRVRTRDVDNQIQVLKTFLKTIPNGK